MEGGGGGSLAGSSRPRQLSLRAWRFRLGDERKIKETGTRAEEESGSKEGARTRAGGTERRIPASETSYRTPARREDLDGFRGRAGRTVTGLSPWRRVAPRRCASEGPGPGGGERETSDRWVDEDGEPWDAYRGKRHGKTGLRGTTRGEVCAGEPRGAAGGEKRQVRVEGEIYSEQPG